MDGTFEVIRWFGPEKQGIPIITADGEMAYRQKGTLEPLVRHHMSEPVIITESSLAKDLIQ